MIESNIKDKAMLRTIAIHKNYLIHLKYKKPLQIAYVPLFTKFNISVGMI